MHADSALIMMPGYKRMESSSPQHARRSRRIANLTGNNGVAAPVKNEDNVADILDETDEDGPSHDTDDDYSSDDEDVENEIDEDGFRAFDKDAEYQKRYIVQDEHTGRVVTIIPHETLRPINGVEYSDYKIHKNTLLYLMDLRANNRRSWFKRKRRPYACYYIHLDPGSSYVGGGLWAPEPPTIQLLRDSINERPEAWRQILSSEDFRNMFLPGGKAGVEGALEAFAEANKEGALKTKPKVRYPFPKN
ncbi:unnamed protein product [Aspergillus oryzae]|nr:unnamed protein product [Aspergillus oryzae]GMF94794.1 unnamed protein product [Aspergillus oryzae]GMG01865.1 unnamed protein product [Aspergillus oryzae]